MGSSTSKLRKHLQNGDEVAALQLFEGSSELRRALDPNCSYGDTHAHDTPLHLASRHAMKALLRIFLLDLGGNPNKRNSRSETALHSVCSGVHTATTLQQQRRVDSLALLLGWRGAVLANGDVEKAALAAQDEKLNTALHYAAASGIKRSVEMLVRDGAPLFLENLEKQTPCDCAEKCGHADIALYLESKMVFSNDDADLNELEDQIDQIESLENYSGLRAQDLQEAKDQLLVETSDMLHVPLFTAEALLRNHEWSREMLLEAWMRDAIACCDKCGVVPPGALYDDFMASAANSSDTPHLDPVASDPSSTFDLEIADDDDDLKTMCEICSSLMSLTEQTVSITCHHQFCRTCWQRYLTGKIEDGEAHNITCPGYDCRKLVSVDVIETVVSRDVARRYLQFDIKAFVESNPSIKWCPFPGCGRAVRLPEVENPLSPSFRALGDPTDTSHAVDCGVGHLFCWECLGEAHEPASCDHLKRWHEKIAEIRPDELCGTEDETESAANCLWLVTNSKPCPNCRSPIQKNEGCNHMKCSKCKHDFCWVCLELWKKHSSVTGGYFRCNRYEVVKKVEEGQDSAKSDAELKNKKLQELNRFVHYYTRFKNHENSCKLELPLLSTAKDKMMVLARAVTDPDLANDETKFVEDAVHQLLKARRVLKSSYIYGYYLADTGYKKPIFEFMQTELEECTEMLSEMVARPYLRTPRTKIIQTALLVQRKRYEFVMAIAKGLVPPDTSPSLHSQRRHFNVELDEDMKKALLASMQDVDASGAWVKAPSGKHTNVAAILDWPEEDDESDSESMQDGAGVAAAAAASTARARASAETDGDEAAADDTPPLASAEVCSREECMRPRARNRRTGDMHEHCSMRCMVLDCQTETPNTHGMSKENFESITDYQMDLLRALEMSRLEFLREMSTLDPSADRSDDLAACGCSRPTSFDGACGACLPAAAPQPGSSSDGALAPAPPPAGQEGDERSDGALDVSPQEGRLLMSLQAPPPGCQSCCSAGPSRQAPPPGCQSCCSAGPSRQAPPPGCHSCCSAGPSRPQHAGVVTHSADPSQNAPASCPRNPKPFGLMKDLSVTNITISDKDKTSQFADKDFRHIIDATIFAAPPARELDAPPQTPRAPPQTPQELGAPPQPPRELGAPPQPPREVGAPPQPQGDPVPSSIFEPRPAHDNPWEQRDELLDGLSADELLLLPNNQRPALRPNHAAIVTSHNQIYTLFEHGSTAIELRTMPSHSTPRSETAQPPLARTGTVAGNHPTIGEEQRPLVISEEQRPLVISEEQHPLVTSEEQRPLVTSEEQRPLVTSEEQRPLVITEEPCPLLISEEQRPLVTSEEQRPLVTSEEERPLVTSDEYHKLLYEDGEQHPLVNTEEQHPLLIGEDMCIDASALQTLLEGATGYTDPPRERADSATCRPTDVHIHLTTEDSDDDGAVFV